MGVAPALGSPAELDYQNLYVRMLSSFGSRLPLLAVFLGKALASAHMLSPGTGVVGTICTVLTFYLPAPPPHLRHTCLPNVDDQVPQHGDGLPVPLVLQVDRTGRRRNRVNRFLSRGVAVASMTPP